MKNAGQGAATTVYAAISHEWEGKGGKYLADFGVQGPFKKLDEGPSALYDDGHVTWIYDSERERRLWKESFSRFILDVPCCMISRKSLSWKSRSTQISSLLN